ncbi:MAG: hypothetical protein LBF71_04675 [Campylobacteraceae bacterium]|jgi:hypothetical protein|nr:hypothetical protein [Campylobacteraceae bacterium]
MKSPYEFPLFADMLNRLGFPPIEYISDFKIKTVDVDIRDVTYDPNGGIIFDGRKGYLYMHSYRISHYNDLPRYHITNCEIIQKSINEGWYSYYKHSNAEYVDIIDRDNKKSYYNQKLELCSKCRKELAGKKISYDLTTEDFHKSLKKEQQPAPSSEFKPLVTLEETKRQIAEEREKRIEAEQEAQQARQQATEEHEKRIKAEQEAAEVAKKLTKAEAMQEIVDLASKLDELLKSNKREGSGLKVRLRSMENSLSDKVFKDALKAIDVRNKISHEGYQPPKEQISKTKQSLETVIAELNDIFAGNYIQNLIKKYRQD